MNVAIITARGGSKRIPDKNIRLFCGRPILAYSIEAALCSGLFAEVMVSTDSAEIAALAEAYGAQVPFMRSANASNDLATTAEVLAEVLAQYAKCEKSFTHLCCLYPTAPFVTAQKLRVGYQKLMNCGASALIPVVAFSFPPLRGCIQQERRLYMKWPEYQNTRSQDLEPIYHDCGQFYWVRVADFLREKTLFCADTVPFVLPETEVQDIDNETDWKLAELKYRLMLQSASEVEP